MAIDNNSKTNIAIIGFGKLGLLHAGVFNAVHDCKVRYIVDTSSTMLNMLKSKLPDVQVFENHNDLLKAHGAEIGAAVIATPSNIHVPIAVDCLEHNIPLFIEKPLAISSEQAVPLVQRLRHHAVTNRVGYMSRFIDTFTTARKMVRQNCLGKLQSLRCSMYIGQLFRQGKGWRYSQAASGGGVLITQNSHLLDLLTWMLGDVQWVSSHAKRLYSQEVEDEMHTYFGFGNGLEGWMDSSWSARHHRTLTMSVNLQGENGTLTFSEDDVSLFLENPVGEYQSGWTHLRKPDLFEGVSFDVAGPHYTRQAEEFINLTRGITASDVHGADIESSFRVQRLIDTIYKSAQDRGQPHSVDYGL